MTHETTTGGNLANGSLWTRIELATQDGQSVAFVEIPPFQPLPAVVVWGQRLFVVDPCNAYRYREAFAYWIPTQAS